MTIQPYPAKSQASWGLGFGFGLFITSHCVKRMCPKRLCSSLKQLLPYSAMRSFLRATSCVKGGNLGGHLVTRSAAVRSACASVSGSGNSVSTFSTMNSGTYVKSHSKQKLFALSTTQTTQHYCTTALQYSTALAALHLQHCTPCNSADCMSQTIGGIAEAEGTFLRVDRGLCAPLPLFPCSRVLRKRVLRKRALQD